MVREILYKKTLVILRNVIQTRNLFAFHVLFAQKLLIATEYELKFPDINFFFSVIYFGI